MAEFREDTGYIGSLLSLGGMGGRNGMGLVTTGQSPSVTTEVILLPANPARYWAIIQNNSATENVDIQLGTQGGFYVKLKPAGTLIIDKNLPWTGSISGVSLGAAAVIRAIEASVQP